MISITENGLTISTKTQIKEDWLNQWKEVYGVTLETESNTPLGNLLDIVAQASVDTSEHLQSMYANLNPQTATGVGLDNIASIRGAIRKTEAYSTQDVKINISQTVILQGLDDYDDVPSNVFTVGNASGDQYYLLSSTTLNSGSHTLSFRAKEYKEISNAVGTVTTIITPIAGVDTVTNEVVESSKGASVEADFDFRARADRTLYLNSKNSADAIYSNIQNLSSVSDVVVYENRTSTTNTQGVSPHSIHVFVEGGTGAEIGNAIYSDIAGAGMDGNLTENILRPSGAYFVARYSRPTNILLHLKLDIKNTTSEAIPEAQIKSQLASEMTFAMGELVETASIISKLITVVNGFVVGMYPVNAEISLDGSVWVNFLEQSTIGGKFTLSSNNISITALS